MLKLKTVSCLEKVRAASDASDYPDLKRLTLLRGERTAFQVLLTLTLSENGNFSRLFTPTLTGPLAKYATLREVRHVPAMFNGRAQVDEDYMTCRPCLMPDILAPLPYGGRVVAVPFTPVTLWVELEIPANYDGPAESSLSLSLELVRKKADQEPFTATASVEVEILAATLPAQKLIFTQWFHADCIADYYGVEKWSDEHFRIIESFARTAKRNGINMLLTPLVTPPLDNEYDTRDLQLARVSEKDGKYVFDWTDLIRWIEMCDRVGIEYLEIGHLFTQGGAACATKVMGTINGEYCRLFAKNTPSDDPEYGRFLRAMLTSFLDLMRQRGDDRRCYFHISDEPTAESLDTYRRAKASVAELLDGYVIMDALSHYEFYECGAVEKPVVILHHLAEFISHGVGGLWTYNCCAPDRGYSNRFLSMTSARNRSISLMLYKFDIEGFLHWGYNFYNNSGSADLIDPFLDTASGGIFPSGDAFSVYPGRGGQPLESIRLATFYHAIEDLSALRLAEELTSRDEVIALLEEELGAPIATSTYVNSAEKLLAIRQRVNELIRSKL